jgi:ADP-ribosylglycohydrolase
MADRSSAASSADADHTTAGGNGSAMRVSPVGFAFSTEAEVLAQAKANSGDYPQPIRGVKGAQATALAVFLAKNGNEKETIRSRVATLFGMTWIVP